MDLYIISYDLKTPGRDYTSLYNAIKDLGEWQHPLESTWVVSTNYDENQIYNILKQTLDDNDLLMIFQIVPEARQGWLAKSFWEWMGTKSKNL
jgi:hypothetical protein BACCOPRO_00146